MWKYWKEEKKFLEGSTGIRAHDLHVTGRVGQIPPKTLKKFITVKYAQWTISIRWYKVHLYILVLHFYLSKIVRTKHLHQ